MFFYDPFYLLFMVPAFLLVFIAQVRVSRAYSKWGRVPNSRSMTGADAAKRLLAYGGMGDVRLEGTRGQLTDHYDPRSNTLRLSAGVAQAPSVAALAISAHEIGHALQDREGYFPLRLRAALIPAANIGSYLGWILIMLGLFLRMVPIAWLGVGAFGLGGVFALATLPVEFNASARARRLLVESGMLSSDEETRGVNAVLDAAALTYVAALATAVLQLLYYVLLIGGLGRRRN
ncbi:MAG: zinc metallopeptidase [Chloroflexi bacterium RBG_16_64_43]|nr:MAG: zinc metallopeptidase [Chloroflexi bacterium RBG_16_64_43]